MANGTPSAKELKIARATAMLWELCYMLETGLWHIEDFDPHTVARLRLLFGRSSPNPLTRGKA